MRSPCCRPNGAAGNSVISPTTGSSTAMPSYIRRPANTAKAKMKLNTGPAATVAARAQSGAPCMVRRRSAALSPRHGVVILSRCRAGIAREFDIAAQRNGRELPDSAALVGALCQHRAKTDGKHIGVECPTSARRCNGRIRAPPRLWTEPRRMPRWLQRNCQNRARGQVRPRGMSFNLVVSGQPGPRYRALSP